MEGMEGSKGQGWGWTTTLRSHTDTSTYNMDAYGQTRLIHD